MSPPRRLRLGVRAKIAAGLCALALISTLVTLIVQSRSLERDLDTAVRSRLRGSAEAAARLLAMHLEGTGRRYLAISRTPEFRANVETARQRNLAFHAERLGREQDALAVVFRHADGRSLASFGSDEAVARALEPWSATVGDAGASLPTCVPADPRPSDPAAPGRFAACVAAAEAAQATLAAGEAGPLVLVSIPLFTGPRFVGSLAVAERLTPEQLERWSELCGAHIEILGPGEELGADAGVREVARDLGTSRLWVATTAGPEREALAHSRVNLLLSGLAALALAFLVTLPVSKELVQPIQRLRRRVEAIGGDDPLGAPLELDRDDEIGDLARAFDDMVGRLRRSQQRLDAVQGQARLGDFSIDLAQDRVTGSRQLALMLGLDPARPAWRTGDFLGCFAPQELERIQAALDACGRQSEPFQMEVSRRDAAGHERTFTLQGLPGAQRPGVVEGSVQDVTELRVVEGQIRFLSYHDPATGLANRRFMMERLARSFRSRSSAQGVLCVVRLEEFDSVVRNAGLSRGEELVREAGKALLLTVRARASRLGLEFALARLGDREFGVWLGSPDGASRAAQAARDLFDPLCGRLTLPAGGGRTLHVQVGAARWPDDGEEAEELVRNAYLAIGRAGESPIEFFSPDLGVHASRRFRIRGLLGSGRFDDTLRLHYQPRVSGDDAAIVGYEALLRCSDPRLGSISPAELIPVAEETGLVGALTRWVLKRLALDLEAWPLREGSLPVLSANLSPDALVPGFEADVRELVGDLDTRRIEFEITESSLMRDERVAAEILGRLREAGHTIALDDFGTGFSSLGHLRDLPIDVVKIDRSFVAGLSSDPRATGLTAASIAMAKTLGMRVVAEGVETREQWEALRDMGCDELQGFLFGAAAPLAEAHRSWLLGRARPKRRGA